jgi:predicted small secreted protein
MKYFKSIIAVFAIVVFIAGIAGCNEGPLERAGKKVDKAVDDIKN